MIKNIRYILIASIIFTGLALASQTTVALTTSQAAAKETGIMLFNQYKPAETQLRIAAEAGDHEAQYYLAESLRKKNSYMNPEAKKWYEMAAAQGDLYAMIQLGRVQKDLCKLSEDCPPTEKNHQTG